MSLNKLQLSTSFKELLTQAIKNGFEILPLTFDHFSGIIGLELHHRDPFDRILISQAIAENLQVITKDEKFNSYPVTVVWD
ncbi:type II toxin-antitoxin system VapC family toxin [Pedobacter sp. UYP24]